MRAGNRSGGDVFEERQSFQGTWVTGLISVMTMGVAALEVWGVTQQVIRHKPWGNHPMSDGALLGQAAVTLVVMGGLAWMFPRMELIVRVEPAAVDIRFRPFAHRVIPYHEIAATQYRVYNPVMEYGGWGVRLGYRKAAYNVSGNQGVELTLKDGKRVMIGSRHYQELNAAIAEQLVRLSQERT